MLPKIYEIHTQCDNCGRLVKRTTVDQATFAALVSSSEPAVTDPDDAYGGDSTLMDAEDLIVEEQDRPVEVYIQHEPVCSHCAESP